jgi:very-short-patch-repair endonuclease
MEDQRSLTWLSQLQGQSGVISRQQALVAGFTAKAIDCKLRSGAWQRMRPGIYAAFTGEPSRQAQLWAAVLRVGPRAALSHESAAEIHGLIDKPGKQIHVSVPAECRVGRNTKIRGVIIHRLRKLVLEWQPPWQLPRTSVEDTVLDLVAAARTFDDAYGWISAAIGRRRTTSERLSNALASRSRVRWRAWIAAALSDTADGVHSPLERNYVHGVERAHGLPAARRQAMRRHGSGNRYLDNAYEDYGVCVELDGVAAHPAEGRWSDTHRDNINLVQGTQTLRYNWPDATENRCQTAAQIATVLRRGGWPGTPRPCGPTCQAAKNLSGDQVLGPGDQVLGPGDQVLGPGGVPLRGTL